MLLQSTLQSALTNCFKRAVRERLEERSVKGICKECRSGNFNYGQGARECSFAASSSGHQSMTSVCSPCKRTRPLASHRGAVPCLPGARRGPSARNVLAGDLTLTTPAPPLRGTRSERVPVAPFQAFPPWAQSSLRAKGRGRTGRRARERTGVAVAQQERGGEPCGGRCGRGQLRALSARRRGSDSSCSRGGAPRRPLPAARQRHCASSAGAAAPLWCTIVCGARMRGLLGRVAAAGWAPPQHLRDTHTHTLHFGGAPKKIKARSPL